jgi:hypothetical protein
MMLVTVGRAAGTGSPVREKVRNATLSTVRARIRAHFHPQNRTLTQRGQANAGCATPLMCG